MTQRQILRALHFHEAAGGAFEFEAAVPRLVQVRRIGIGGPQQLDLMFVERVDQGDEACRLVAVFRVHARDADEDHRVVGPSDSEVVGRPSRLGAQFFEAEHGDALQGFGHSQLPPAADIEFGRRNMDIVLGRIVGEAEEGLADLRRRGLAQRRVPGVHAGQPLQPVVDRAVQRQHIQFLFDQANERQEMLAVEPVLVKLRRRAVGGGDHGNAFVADQRGEQPAHDHRIGRIVDHHLVEGEAFEVPGQRGGGGRDRVAGLLLALDAEPGVDFDHEGMEMDAALLTDVQAVVEQVHQHRFAATDPAPQIDAAHRFAFLAEQFAEQAASRVSGFELPLQPVQAIGGLRLFGVRLELAGGDQRLVAGDERRH